MSAIHLYLTCRKCRHPYGHWGDPVTAPPCPRCGAAPDPADLRHDQEQIDGFRELLRARADGSFATAPALKKMRLASGLTVSMVVRLLPQAAEQDHLPPITRDMLLAWEAGTLPIPAGYAAHLASFYGFPGEPPHSPPAGRSLPSPTDGPAHPTEPAAGV